MSKYEFVKVGNRYMIKNSNGRIVSEKEKLELENKELVLEDIKSSGCQGKITKKISKNKKRIKEIENIEALKEVSPIVKGETALEEKEDAEDDIIEETNTTV